MFNLGEKYSRNQWITQAYNNVLGTSILQFVKWKRTGFSDSGSPQNLEKDKLEELLKEYINTNNFLEN